MQGFPEADPLRFKTFKSVVYFNTVILLELCFVSGNCLAGLGHSTRSRFSTLRGLEVEDKIV